MHATDFLTISNFSEVPDLSLPLEEIKPLPLHTAIRTDQSLRPEGHTAGNTHGSTIL